MKKPIDRNTLLLRYITLFLLIVSSRPAAAVYFQHLGMEDGLVQLSVMSIYQDRLGRMWFGTMEGISIYDGNRMVPYKPTGKHSENGGMHMFHGAETHAIHGDGKGNIYFTSDDALIHYEDEAHIFTELVPQGVNALAHTGGDIWFACQDSLFRIASDGKSVEFNSKLYVPRINALLMKRGGGCLVGTVNGLFLFDEVGLSHCLLPGIDVFKLYECSRGDVWISTRKAGLYRMKGDGTFIFYDENEKGSRKIASKQVREVMEDEYRNIWIATFQGLHRYNPEQETMELFRRDYLPGSLTHSSIFPIYRDTQGTMWVGTYYGGVNYFNPSRDVFTHYTDDPSRDDCLSYPMIGNMVEDKRGDIWICTEGGGLNRLEHKTGRLTYFMADSENPNSLAHNNLKSIVYDSISDCLYLGSHTGGFCRMDIATKSFRKYWYPGIDMQKYPGDVIVRIGVYNDEVIVGANNGVFRMNPITGESEVIELTGTLTDLLVTRNGELWYGGNKRLRRYDLNQRRMGRLYDFADYGIDFDISRIKEFSDGTICLATTGAGMFRYDSDSDRLCPIILGGKSLLSLFCYNLAETNDGHLLISSDKGLTLYNPTSDYIRHLQLGNGLPLKSLTEGCGLLVTRENRIYMAGADGMVSFFRENFGGITTPSQFYFSNIQVNGRSVMPGDRSGILKKALPFTECVRLSHNENNLIFTFAESNYIGILSDPIYEYRLEGFDEGWMNAAEKNIYYTNLSPGHYVLHVRKWDDAPGGECLEEIALPITIRAPWYATHFCICLWVILFSTIVWNVYRFFKGRRRLTAALHAEKAEKEKNEAIMRAKLHFFTNISHEFRTPLTLIISHVDMILQQKGIAPPLYARIRKIQNQSEMMHHLITELLDFRKMEEQRLTLHVAHHNLYPLLDDIFCSFRELSVKHRIDYRFTAEAQSLACWYDERQLQKVFYNLLGNAFKFTPEGGSIELIVSQTDERINIQIVDSGVGIAPEEMERVFEQFYQSGESQKLTNANPGTGLGLALSRNIVELHGGEIHVESRKGYGSIFRISLLKQKEYFMDNPHIRLCDEQEEAPCVVSNLPALEETDSLVQSEHEGVAQAKYTVLLVEDNEELLTMLQSAFSPFYEVLLAHNGGEGLEMARSHIPDLIVSDVMMPVMSGMDMCLQIKNNIDLCHIPIVLLTALNSPEQNVAGLRHGADDYVTKPFDIRILLARCNNLVRNRIILHRRYNRQVACEVDLLATNELDKRFLERTQAIIDANIDNQDFDVNTLVGELAIGRSTLFAKFKALTGMSPNEFILNYKLKKASRMLLADAELSVAEISDRLGFGSPRYFSRCFKSQFEVSPAEYRKNGKLKDIVAE